MEKIKIKGASQQWRSRYDPSTALAPASVRRLASRPNEKVTGCKGHARPWRNDINRVDNQVSERILILNKSVTAVKSHSITCFTPLSRVSKWQRINTLCHKIASEPSDGCRGKTVTNEKREEKKPGQSRGQMGELARTWHALHAIARVCATHNSGNYLSR